MARPRNDHRTVTTRVDSSLIGVIKDVQKEIEQIEKEAISFVEASRALALHYHGIPLQNNTNNGHKRKKRRFDFFSQL